MDNTMDNQQVTTEKIAWLAGIWDGEGTLSIVKKNRNQDRIGLSPKATMENTSAKIIDECCSILDGLGITFYISERKLRSGNHKQAYVLQICRLDMIIKFCETLIPYLVDKKAQASLLKRYAVSRIRLISGKNGKKVPYSNEEINLCEDLQNINKLGPVGTSTTLRETLYKQLINQKRWFVKRGEKIKSDLYGNI